MIAIVELGFLLIISAGLNVALFASHRQQSGRIRQLERDRHIGELERDLRMDLPALASDTSPLVRVTGALIGIWLANYYRRHR